MACPRTQTRRYGARPARQTPHELQFSGFGELEVAPSVQLYLVVLRCRYSNLVLGYLNQLKLILQEVHD